VSFAPGEWCGLLWQVKSGAGELGRAARPSPTRRGRCAGGLRPGLSPARRGRGAGGLRRGPSPARRWRGAGGFCSQVRRPPSLQATPRSCPSAGGEPLPAPLPPPAGCATPLLQGWHGVEDAAANSNFLFSHVQTRIDFD
jgi:hypothetical protein